MVVGVTWLSKLVIEILTLHFLGEVRAGNYLISYKSPTILLAAICLLLFFERIKFSSIVKKLVGIFSPIAFGVYLIHTHPLVFSYFMKNRFAEYAAFPWYIEILLILGTAVCINLACYAIDFIRLEIFKGLHIRQKIDLLEERIKMKILQ